MSTAATAPPNSRVLAALTGMTLTSDAPPPISRAQTVPGAFKQSSLVRLTPPVAATRPTDSTAVSELPVYSYSKLSPAPKMRFACTEADADKWVRELDLTQPIAMDCEWVFIRKKGGSIRPVSVIQLADKKNILVIQLRNSKSTMARFPIHLQRLLEDPEVPKMGANILNDAKKLFKDYGIMTKNVIELGGLAKQADPPSIAPDVFRGRKIVALAKLVERYLRKRLRKDEQNRLGNWEAENLSAEMLEYAANDSYCALQVYHHLVALAKTNAVTLDPTKYTDRVHYECLHSTPSSDPEGVLSVPTIVLTPRMIDASMLPQQLRAYRYFLAKRYLDMDTMCKELCVKSAEGQVLKRNTVVAYVIGAIKAWHPFRVNLDLASLRLLVQTDLRSWEYNYEWISGVAQLGTAEQ